MGEGHEVEHIEVSVVGVGTVHGHHVLGGVVGQPAVEDVGADGGLVDLAALDHFGAVDAGLGVVDAADGVDEDVVSVVVLGVLLHDPGLQRLVGGQIEGTAAVGGLCAGSELVAGLFQQRAVSGLVGQIAQQAQEAREVVGQGVGQGVVIHSSDTHGVEVHRCVGGGVRVGGSHGDDAAAVHGVGGAVIVHDAGVGVVQIDVVAVVVVSACDVSGDEAHVGGGVVRGQDVLQSVHEVLCGNGGHDLAVAVHPVLLTQMERPGQGVDIPVPAGGQAFTHDAFVVVLDQRIHAVCAHDHLKVSAGGQVVQGSGLAVVQDGVAGAGTGRGCAGSAAGGRAAAASQQAGCAGTGGCQAAGLQELTAGDGSVHHKFPLFLFLLYKGQHRVVRCPLFPGNGQMDHFL